jgi:outer membrane protein OmpA-like peptidoglycan-associated protein
MATIPTRPPNQTGAVAADTRKRRRPPIWLWLLLLLLALLLLALLLYAIFHKTHNKKASAAAPVASTAPSTSETPLASPSAVPSASPSSVASTILTPAPGATTSSYGVALIGGGAVAAAPATGIEGAAASSTSGVTSSDSAGTASATGPQGTVLFPTGSAVIDAAGLQVIQSAATRIKALHPSAVTVTGYTDVVGGQPKNDTLSQQRAAAVAAVLRRDLGASTTVTATAKGESDPIAPNTTAAGRQQNRRASITGS